VLITWKKNTRTCTRTHTQ